MNRSHRTSFHRSLISAPLLRLTQTALLGATLAAALSACAVGPDYVKPADTMPAAFPHAAANVAGNAAPLTLDVWWTQFNDPALTRIIERVLAQNLDLAAALARVDQARAAAHLSQAQLLPQGSADATVARQRQSLQGRLGVRVSVAAEAADAYFRVRGAQTRIALAQLQTKADSDLLELVKLRLADGLSTERELAEAQARVAQVKAGIPPLRSELAIQLNRLDVLMGAQPGTYAAELAGAGNDAEATIRSEE